jgi:ABC-type lipoprotein export system ATPase subunit
VAIARALVNRPPLLFADEPTGNLDSRTSEEVLKMFGDLNKAEGITIVLVTHAAEVAVHATRTIRIRDGLLEDAADAEKEGVA